MYLVPSATIIALIVVILLYFRKSLKALGNTLAPSLPIIAEAVTENVKVYGIESHADNLLTVRDRQEEVAARGLDLSMSIDDLLKQPTRRATITQSIDDSII